MVNIVEIRNYHIERYERIKVVVVKSVGVDVGAESNGEDAVDAR